MSNRLFVTGGQFRPPGALRMEGRYYQEAQLVALDLASGEFESLVTLSGGGDHYPPEHPNQLFTAPAMEDGVLWLPSETEIFKYRLPTLTLEACYSHTCFNNIHSVAVFGDELAVTSTGLDNVVFLNKHDGRVMRIANAEGKDPWHRFSHDIDYRREYSTRPHDAHPNFVFRLGENYWVTRCTHEDAVNLDDTSQSIDVAQGDDISVHDGLDYGDYIVFTRVDGFLVFCDKTSLQVAKVVDPFQHERNRPIGWCRGLHINGSMCYIGYSRIRKTRMKSKLKYLASGNFEFASGQSALIVAFDLEKLAIERIYRAPEGVVDAIYGILAVPPSMDPGR